MKEIHLIASVKALLAEDERALRATLKSLEKAPPGFLGVRARGGRERFYSVNEGEKGHKERYLNKRARAELTGLVNKRYCRKLKIALTAEIGALREFLEHFDPTAKLKAADCVPECLSSLLNPVVLSPREVAARWERQEYRRSSYPLDGEGHRTREGEYVRSRGEYIIATKLMELGLPYRYECALKLDKGSEVFPDFTIMNPGNNQVYYLEYFGMMDDEHYAVNCFNKIARYQASDYAPYFIPVFDHKYAPFSAQQVESLLRRIFF